MGEADKRADDEAWENRAHLLTVPSELENPFASSLIWRKCLLIIFCGFLISGCRSESVSNAPSIEFTKVPLFDEGGTPKMVAIEGRVIGAHPGQQIVLFARSGAWYVQPLVEESFTKIQADATWKNSTHMGTEYAALLVEPEYRPPNVTDALPGTGAGVIAVAIVPGEARLLLPIFWHTWWFRLLVGLACLSVLLAYHRLRLRKLAHQLNARFDERLEERMRIAQDLQIAHVARFPQRVHAALRCGRASPGGFAGKVEAEPGSAVDGTGHRRRPKHGARTTLHYRRLS